jgi:anti-anti-sigma factor
MHISVEPSDDHAVLHLRGEFDTYYVPLLQQEIEALGKAGITRVVLNLRLVKFINSTALGAMIKASKQLTQKGGRLAISRPSSFCRDIIEKVGLDRAVPVFETDEEAVKSLGASAGAQKAATGSFEEEPSSVIFAAVDNKRIEHFLSESKILVKAPLSGAQSTGWSGIGRMAALDSTGMRFTWSGGNSGLSPFAMAQLLAIGTEWKVKFRLGMLHKGYCEAVCTVREVEERSDGVKVGAKFTQIDQATKDAIDRYASDMAFLKDELRKATDR